LVCVYLLESLELLHESLSHAGLTDRLAILEQEAQLVLAGCAASTELLRHDAAVVEEAYRMRFGPPSRGG